MPVSLQSYVHHVHNDVHMYIILMVNIIQDVKRYVNLLFCNAGHLLAHGNLVRHCADTFLASEHKDIRMEAVRTCSRLLSPSLHVSQIRNNKSENFQTVFSF